MFGIPTPPFSLSGTAKVVSLGYQHISTSFDDFASIESVASKVGVDNVCMIIADPLLVQTYVNFFDNKVLELRAGLNHTINDIEVENLNCRVKFGNENSRDAHDFVKTKWGLKESGHKMKAFLKGKRVFLTDGIPPCDLTKASSQGNIDTGNAFFELEEVRKDIIMVFANIAMFLEIHCTSSLDPAKLADIETSAELSTVANSDGTIYTFVSEDLVFLYLAANHVYNILNTTQYIYQTGGLWYPTVYAHIDYILEFVTTIISPVLSQSLAKNIDSRSEKFVKSTKVLTDILAKSKNKQLKKIREVVLNSRSGTVEKVSYMNHTPAAGIANMLAKKSFDNITGSMDDIKDFISEVAEMKGHYEHMQVMIAQNNEAIEASKNIIALNHNKKTLKYFGGFWESRKWGGSNVGYKFKKAIPIYEVFRLVQSYSNNILYKVEKIAPTAILKFMLEAMPLQKYYFDMARPIMRLMFAYNEHLLSSSLLNTFISNLYTRMFDYYDAFFGELKNINTDHNINTSINKLINNEFNAKDISVVLINVNELKAVKQNVVVQQQQIIEQRVDINLQELASIIITSNNLDGGNLVEEETIESTYQIQEIRYNEKKIESQEIIQSLFGEKSNKGLDKAFNIELSGNEKNKELTMTLNDLYVALSDSSKINVIQTWIDKVIMVNIIKEGSDNDGVGDRLSASTLDINNSISNFIQERVEQQAFERREMDMKDIEKMMAVCFPMEMPMLRYLFRKRTAVSLNSMCISAVTPFYLLVDTAYSMVLHSFVASTVQDQKITDWKNAKTSAEIMSIIKVDSITVTNEIPEDEDPREIDKELKHFVSQYMQGYERVFMTDIEHKYDINDDANMVIVAAKIAEKSKELLLPSMALVLATLMSLFERLVVLDLAKRCATETIKEYGIMVFYNEDFSKKLKTMYADEKKIASVMEYVIYKLMPMIEEYGNVHNCYFWKTKVSKAYYESKDALVRLFNSIHNHSVAAVDYMGKAEIYLKDHQEVNVKQKAYLTLLSNVHDFLKMQVKDFGFGEVMCSTDYDNFVSVAVIGKDEISESIEKESDQKIQRLNKYVHENKYKEEADLFLYTMVSTGLCGLLTKNPEPSNDIVTAQLSSESLLGSLYSSRVQEKYFGVGKSKARLKQPTVLSAQLYDEIVQGSFNKSFSTLDSCIWESFTGNNPYIRSDLNKLLLVLNFIDESDNPFRAILTKHIKYFEEYIHTIINTLETNVKRVMTAMLVYGVLNFSRRLIRSLNLFTGIQHVNGDTSTVCDKILQNILTYIGRVAKSEPWVLYNLIYAFHSILNNDGWATTYSSKISTLIQERKSNQSITKEQAEVHDMYVTLAGGMSLKGTKLIAQQLTLSIMVMQDELKYQLANIETFVHENYTKLKIQVVKGVEACITGDESEIYDIENRWKRNAFESPVHVRAKKTLCLLRSLKVTDNSSGGMLADIAPAYIAGHSHRLYPVFDFVLNPTKIDNPKQSTKSKKKKATTAKKLETKYGWGPDRVKGSRYIPEDMLGATKISESDLLGLKPERISSGETRHRRDIHKSDSSNKGALSVERDTFELTIDAIELLSREDSMEIINQLKENIIAKIQLADTSSKSLTETMTNCLPYKDKWVVALLMAIMADIVIISNILNKEKKANATPDSIAKSLLKINAITFEPNAMSSNYSKQRVNFSRFYNSLSVDHQLPEQLTGNLIKIVGDDDSKMCNRLTMRNDVDNRKEWITTFHTKYFTKSLKPGDRYNSRDDMRVIKLIENSCELHWKSSEKKKLFLTRSMCESTSLGSSSYESDINRINTYFPLVSYAHILKEIIALKS